MDRIGLPLRCFLWIAVGLMACSGDDPGASSATESTGGDTSSTSTTDETSTSTADASTSSASGESSSTSTSTSDATTTDETTSTTAVTSTTDAGACGDGVLDDGEACDGDELGGQTCADLDFDGGALGCAPDCAFDTSACTTCGDGQVDAGEECDDGNSDPGDGCDAECKVEAEDCDPDGLYAVQGPALTYTCCVGLVDINVSAFTFTNDGASILSSPSNPVPMSGAPTTCPDGDFANQGSIPGGCTESYALTGSFDDKDTWTGTYEIKFQGQQCTCLDGQLGTPCVDQSFAVTAQR
ncbi:MAG: hypothetical protein R3A79_13780 [Nannocystaceae bacterium]